MMCDCKKYGSRWACKLAGRTFYDELEATVEYKICRKEDEEAAADFLLDQERDERLEEERRNG